MKPAGKFNVVGMNHRTAPLAVREWVAVSKEELVNSLHLLRSFLPSTIIVSTCNRTEIYWVGSETQDIREKAIRFLNRKRITTYSQLRASIYVKKGQDAVRHLIRTTSGLDSMILGEHEILGQVKEALRASESAGMVSYPLRFIFQSAIRTGRRVRERTGISRLPLSVSSIAIDFAEKAVGNMSSCKMLVIGAGEVGALVVKAARMRGTGSILVASRSMSHAAEIAGRVGGTGVDISELGEILPACSIVVTCADSPHWVITASHVREAMLKRPHLPLVIIDVAVPRNVQPEAGTVTNVTLHNMDDLNAVCEQNRRLREQEVLKAEAMIEADVAGLETWWHNCQVRPAIVALMMQAEKTRERLLNKTLSRLSPLSDEDRYSLEMMSKALVKQVLSSPLDKLKTEGASAEEYAAMVRQLFDLDAGEEE